MEYCWMGSAEESGVGLRLPLYGGKLDLMAFSQVHKYDPKSLSLRLEKEEILHPLDIDYSNGLSRASLQHLIGEVKLLYEIELPDGKSLKSVVVITGSALQTPAPTWLPKLTAASFRGTVRIEQVMSYQFMQLFRDSIFVNDPDLLVFNQATRSIDKIIPGVPRPEEEDVYIDRHLPHCVKSAAELKCAIEELLPTGYSWLSEEETARKSRLFSVPVLNMDVLVTSSTTALLVLDGAAAVLGIDVVSELSWNSVLKSEADFYLWAMSSPLPHVQLVTDLKSGAVAFYCYGTIPETHPLGHQMAAVPMPASDLVPFLNRLVSVLPPDDKPISWALQAQRRMTPIKSAEHSACKQHYSPLCRPYMVGWEKTSLEGGRDCSSPGSTYRL